MSMLIRDTMTPINDSNNLVTNSSNNLENNAININNNLNLNSNSNSNSKSNSSTTLNMPSPPLSPYTRNNYDENDNLPTLLFPRASKPLTSDLRYLDIYHSPKPIIPLSNSNSISTLAPKTNDQSDLINSTNSIDPVDSSEKVESSTALPSSSSSLSSLSPSLSSSLLSPISKGLTDILGSDSILHIDPYKQLNKPGFKKFQLNFLSQYQFKSLTSNSSSNPYSSLNYNRYNSITRPAIRHTYDTIKSSNNTSNYNSNSDSDIEKPRTRRFVRQNKFELKNVENSDSIISRPSTPIKRKYSNNNSVGFSSSPSTPKRQRTSTPIIYNYDYKKIEDFCPPLDTLPSNNKCLKTDWKGQSMDLSNDPLVNELHPAEIVLASILRLPCAVYLDSKRRIFQEKVKRMKYNLPFRRTDAQKSCKIDVNKASRLFASFEKVGWFDEKHFQKFM